MKKGGSVLLNLSSRDFRYMLSLLSLLPNVNISISFLVNMGFKFPNKSFE